MSQPPSGSGGGARMSRGVKLVLMGVAGAALLYSCAPGVGGGLGALPYLWFFSNPFYRGPAATSTATPGSSVSPGTTARSTGTATTTQDAGKAAPAHTQSQRGGFGSTGSRSGSSSSS